MNIRPTKGFKQLITRIKKDLGLKIVDALEIPEGHANRLFCLTTSNKQKLLAKFYFSTNYNSLDREFAGFKFLNEKGFSSIPKAYLANDKYQYAVYSFEEGKSKNIKEFTKKDFNKIIEFIIELQSFAPKDVRTKFTPAYRAYFSIKDYIDKIYFRFGKYFKEKDLVDKYLSSVDSLKNLDFKKFIDNKVKIITSSFKKQELVKPITYNKKRLNPSDFGAHNIIIRPDDSFCFIDFEDFGWDDPIKIIADFISHPQNVDLSKETKDYFKNEYKKKSHFNPEDSKRLETAIKIISLEWLVYHLASPTTEWIEKRKFANPNFDKEAYIKEQFKKLEFRVNQARQF